MMTKHLQNTRMTAEASADLGLSGAGPLARPVTRTSQREKDERGVLGWWIFPSFLLGILFWVAIVRWVIF